MKNITIFLFALISSVFTATASPFEGFNQSVHFLPAEESLKREDIRTLFDIAKEIPEKDLIKEIVDNGLMDGSELIAQMKGRSISGKGSFLTLSAEGEAAEGHMELYFLKYRSIRLTDEQLTELKNSTGLGDAIISASRAYGCGVMMSCTLKKIKGEAEVKGLSGVNAAVKAGNYSISIKSKVLGGNLGKTAKELLKLVAQVQDVEVATTVLNNFVNDESIIEPKNVTGLGYLITLNESKLPQKQNQQQQQTQQQVQQTGSNQQQQQIQQKRQ